MTGRRRRTAPRTAPALVGVLATVLAACTVGPSERPPLATYGEGGTPAPPTATSLPLGPGGPGRSADPIEWEVCEAPIPTRDSLTGQVFAVECAVVVVDTEAPAGRDRVALQVSRARAEGVADDAESLVTLLDGPGVNGRERVAAVAGSLSEAVRARYAVIAVDLGGTGATGAVDCLSSFDLEALVTLPVDPGTTPGAERLAETSRSITFSCTDDVGPELSGYNSTAAADTLDGLRTALEQERLTLLGRGFGATLAAVYAHRYPGRVQAAVLDGPSDPRLPSEETVAEVARAQEAALEAFAAACPGFAEGCPLGDDPRARITAIIAGLDDDAGVTRDGRLVTGGSVLLTLMHTLGQVPLWPDLADAMARAGAGDPDPLYRLLGRDFLQVETADPVEGAVLYACNDTAARLPPDQLLPLVEGIRGEAPLFGPFALGLLGVCASWPAPDAALSGLTAAGAAPILVLGSTDDPTSPYETVRSLAAQLESAVLVSWQSRQHGAYPASACVRDAVDAYLLTAARPAAGTLCPP